MQTHINVRLEVMANPKDTDSTYDYNSVAKVEARLQLGNPLTGDIPSRERVLDRVGVLLDAAMMSAGFDWPEVRAEKEAVTDAIQALTDPAEVAAAEAAFTDHFATKPDTAQTVGPEDVKAFDDLPF